ncbi:myosin-7B-like, partial [Scomber scombrus]
MDHAVEVDVNLETTCCDDEQVKAGTKRVWMSDDVEAYTEVEVRELNGDKSTVETKDGR